MGFWKHLCCSDREWKWPYLHLPHPPAWRADRRVGAAAFSPCSGSQEAKGGTSPVFTCYAHRGNGHYLCTSHYCFKWIFVQATIRQFFCCQQWKTYLIFTFFLFITPSNLNSNFTKHLNSSYSPKLLPPVLCALVEALVMFPCVVIMTISPLESKLLEGRGPVSFILASHNALSTVTSNSKCSV